MDKEVLKGQNISTKIWAYVPNLSQIFPEEKYLKEKVLFPN